MNTKPERMRVDQTFLVFTARQENWTPRQLAACYWNMTAATARGLLDETLSMDSDGTIKEIRQ